MKPTTNARRMKSDGARDWTRTASAKDRTVARRNARRAKHATRKGN
jgi:hypothetical protein